MRKGIAALIDSIVEKNPYDYSLWENIFIVKSESEVFERALEFFPTSPMVWKRYIEYLQNQKSVDKHNLFNIFQRSINQCPCIMIWKLFIPFIDSHINSLKEKYNMYQLALDTVGSDPRSGFIWKVMYKLRLLVYNTLISKNDNINSGNILLLNPFETSTIPAISDNIEECVELGDKIATIVTLRQFFIQWLTTPVDNLETAFIAYSLFENSISNDDSPNVNLTIGGMVTTTESASKIVTKNLLQSGEKLVNTSKLIYKSIILLVDELNESIPARPLDKKSGNEWLNNFIPWKRYILYEKKNPLNLDKNRYFNRVSYSYKNCLLYFSYNPEVWYEYFIFVWNYHPIQFTGIDMATELLNSAIQRFLPKDEILKLILAEVYEVRRKFDRVMQIYMSMVYIENANDDIKSGNSNDDKNNEKGNIDDGSNEGNSGADTNNNNSNANCNSISNSSGDIKMDNSDDKINDNSNLGDNVNSNINILNTNEQNDTSDGNCNSFITSNGLLSKQYNPNVSAVVVIEYLNFVLRCTCDRTVWREIFLDYIKRSPNINDIKWICYSQALNEWRLYNNLDGAYRAFYIGMYHRHLFLNTQFMSCFISFLLDTGKIQQARSTLQSCIYEIYKETGKTPKELWLKWFHLERLSGSSINTLNYLNRIYQLQREGKNIEMDMLCGDKQRQSWHSVLGAPEFAELNKEHIGNDADCDIKTKVYGNTYTINDIENDSNDNNNVTNTFNSGNDSNNNLSEIQSSSENKNKKTILNNKNKSLLSYPNSFKTIFECFKFESIYPNTCWSEFSSNIECSKEYCYNEDHNDDDENFDHGYTKHYINTKTNNIISKGSSDVKHNAFSGNCNNDDNNNNTNKQVFKSLYESKNDDFESFLMQKPLEFRLIKCNLNNKADNIGNHNYSDFDSDIDIIDGMNDDEIEYLLYNNKNIDITHINEFTWHRTGRSLCPKPDISKMIKFCSETYPIKNNTITGVDTNSQMLNYLQCSNSIINYDENKNEGSNNNKCGYIADNVEDILNNNNSNYSFEAKPYNTQLPKGIIDFVLLLPPSNIPNVALRSYLGITHEIIDYFITSLQTTVLPQKINLYKYDPINTSDFKYYNDITTSCGNNTICVNNKNGNINTVNSGNINVINTNINIIEDIINKTSNKLFNNNSNIVNSGNSSFFTPCNVPVSNRFSNKPNNNDSKVKIQL
ncbi:mRNA 3 end processing RNA14 [Cryptosporidium xiaoi]|uniref:mRNA 3 end processing RNA14 n=1 Tax=Cryptosporidium xiaoi TaxID=659607 RepID=A0AAV9XTN5_9CRYT